MRRTCFGLPAVEDGGPLLISAKKMQKQFMRVQLNNADDISQNIIKYINIYLVHLHPPVHQNPMLGPQCASFML